MVLRLLVVLLSFGLSAGHAIAQERQWTLDASDEDAYLVFGVPDSDDVGISLWCPIRRGLVNVFVPAAGEGLPPGKSAQVTLEAGDRTLKLDGRAEVNADAGVSSVEVQISADDPFFDALREADRFRVGAGPAQSVFPLLDADIDGLLALCRSE